MKETPKLSPIQLIRKTLQLDKDTVWMMAIFGVCISLLSLVIPIAVQTVVNTLAFSRFTQPIFVLVIIVVVCLFFAGILRVCQLSVLESKQQELFVNIALLFSNRLKRLNNQAIRDHRGPELVNRFFEVIPVQKTLSLILIYGLEVIIQSITSFLLLAFYHPYLMALELVIVVMTTLSIILPYRKAIKSAFDESDHKHETATWLEEYFHSSTLFKFAKTSDYTHNKVDDALCRYVSARKSHFRQLILHFIGFYSTYIVANALLLGLGGYLVIKQRLTLGQLVASEIILNILMGSFIRFSYSLKQLYDLAASSRKLNSIFNFEFDKDIDSISETNRTFFADQLNRAPSLKVNHLSFYRNKKCILNNINITFDSGKTHVIFGPPQSGKTVLMELIMGFQQPPDGQILVNDIALNEDTILLLRNISTFVQREEFVLGTILENITLSNDGYCTTKLTQLLTQFGVMETINHLSNGLDTNMLDVQPQLSANTLFKLIIIRIIVSEPKLIFIDQYFDKVNAELIQLTLSSFNEHLEHPTIIIATENPELAKIADNYVELGLP